MKYGKKSNIIERFKKDKVINKVYYYLKPFIPRALQIAMRRKIVSMKRKKYSHIWPILESSRKPPKEWTGWPNNKKFAVVLTHDVDTQKGHDKCELLLELENEIGFRSSFNFVPQRYGVSSELLRFITDKGFEVGVHGLIHDGKLYNSREIFKERAKLINSYLRKWNSVGFRSPAMHHNLEWIHDLDILYDASTFDTDPFEPQSDGVATIYPFWVVNSMTNSAYVELPYTLCQDFTLFIIMQEKNINIWKRKVDWIVKNGGMVLVNTHPDYMNFDTNKTGLEEYPAKYYEELLIFIQKRYSQEYFCALPKEIAEFFAKSFPLKQNYLKHS